MTLSRHLYAILGLATILTAVSLSSTHTRPAPAAPGTQNVKVVNTAAEPVPTNINSLPAVQIASGQSVGITGTPSVSLSGTPTVNVNSLPAVQIAPNQSVSVSGNVTLENSAQDPLLVKDVSSAREPIDASEPISIPNGQEYQSTVSFYSVPAGKKLTITTIYCTVGVPAGQAVVYVTLGRYPIPMPDPRGAPAILGGASVQSATLDVQGTFTGDIGAVVIRNGSTGVTTGTIGFTGYLEDAP